jgi:opacity protein-like surface antigen
MKRLLIASSLICLLMMAAQAAAPANFSGTWTLDKSKSEGLQGPMANADVTLTVTQDGKQLAVETKYSGGQREIPAQTLNYKLDGSETTADFAGRMPGKGTLKAKWMGDSMLELHTVRNINVQGNDVTITSTEHWELADGGKTLKIHRTTESPRGTNETKLVFTKK